MKLLLTVIFIVLFLSPNQAQEVSIEKDFERQRPGLSVDRYGFGEDATSGYDYLIYKRRSQIIKIRAIWNGGASSAPEVADYYFKNGSPVLYVRMLAKKAHLSALTKGRNAPLVPVEKLYLKESKLTTWIENGQTIPSSDTRWTDKEKEVLEQFKNELEMYQMHKEGKL